MSRLLGILLVGVALAAQEPVNQDARKVTDFLKKIDDYIKLRNQADNGLPKLKPTDVPGAISKHERELATRILGARPRAVQGEIGIAMQGRSDARVKKSLEHAEPVNLTLKVGDTYPKNVPLQTTPTTLLQNLPKLPKELEYRIVNQSLVLRDTGANLVIDFIPDAIPQ